MMRRCAISFFFDEAHILDDYYVYFLREIRPFVEKIVLVVNGTLTAESAAKAESISDILLYRENIGFDVWAYKYGLGHLGALELSEFHEVLLFNHTFFAPIYPFEEMFTAMDSRSCDFWGITAHKKCIEQADGVSVEVPFHLNSHFIAVRQPMLSSEAFNEYWDTMSPINSYNESIQLHELKFTKHFIDLGYVCGTYVDPEIYGEAYSAFSEVDVTIANRSPLLKRRPFFHDPMFLEEKAVDLPRALRIIESQSTYPTELIWRNLIRTTPARVLYTNASLLRVLPDGKQPPSAPRSIKKIAVCVHAHYADLIEEILDRTAFLQCRYDLIVTTDTPQKKLDIEAAASARKGIDNVIVRLLGKTRGRDMSSLFVTCADLFSDDRYDLVCRLHTKKSIQVNSALGNYFKRFMLDNVLASSDYAENVIALFESEPSLGIAMPPMIHISVPTLGHAWFINRDNVVKLSQDLELRVPIDADTPIATYGGMYWFRPKALKKLFNRFDYDDFEPEPLKPDGTLAHALERVLVYVAQDAGYHTCTIACPHQIEHAYTALEYKACQLTSRLPTGTFRKQVELLSSVQPDLVTLFSKTDKKRPPGGLFDDFKVEAHERILDQQRHLDENIRTHMRARLRGITCENLRQNKGDSIVSLSEEIRDITNLVADIGFYAKIKTCDKEDILDYVANSYLTGKEIIPFFDSIYYLERYPDVAIGGMHPCVHFIRYGWQEARIPHPVFDLEFLRKSAPSMVSATNKPFIDYIMSKNNKTIMPHPLFVPRYYIEQIGEKTLAGMSPLQHYLEIGFDRFNPHPLFDTAYYLNHSPELIPLRMPALVHFIKYGGQEGRSPSAAFSSTEYLLKNRDVLGARINPLMHYMVDGIYESREGGLNAAEEKILLARLKGFTSEYKSLGKS